MIQQLQDSIARLSDTISRLRQQLEESLQHDAPTDTTQTAATGSGDYLWLILLMLLLLLLTLGAYLKKRRQYAAADRDLRGKEMRIEHLAQEVTRLHGDLEKEKKKAPTAPTTSTTPTTTPTTPTKPATPTTPTTPTTAPTPSPAGSFESIYHGKALYTAVANGDPELHLDTWSRNDTYDFIEYYRLQHRDFVESLDNDYQSLSRNHKLFMVLVHMGKSDSDIQKLLNITQTTIRSLRFRIKAKRKSPNDTQQTIVF